MPAPSAALALAAVVLAVPAAAQRTIRVTDSRALLAAVPGLAPGDVLELAPGTYELRSLRLNGLAGRADAPITFRSTPGTRAVLRGTAVENVVNVTDCAWLRFEDLDITSAGQGGGVDGVKFTDGSRSQDVTFDGCHLHGLSGNGIASQADRLERLTVAACEIDHVGGCGVYLGYPSTPPRVAVGTRIVDCYLHDIADPTQSGGYGIQIKAFSDSARIERNVLHRVGGRDRAAIALYYPDPAGRVAPQRWNVVRGNLLWDLPNEGVFVVNGAVVENNVIVDADTGIDVSPYAGSRIDNLRIVHNTVYRCRNAAASLAGWPNVDASCVLANNALLQDDPGAAAIANVARGFGAAAVAGNVVHGTAGRAHPGLRAIGAPAAELRRAGPGVAVVDLDLQPRSGSGFEAAADATYLIARDVGGHPRDRAAPVPGACAARAPSAPRLAAAFMRSSAGLAPRAAHLRPSRSVDWTVRTASGSAPFAVLVASALDLRSAPWLRLDPWTSLAFDPAASDVFVGYVGLLDADGEAQPRLALPAVTLPDPITLYQVGVWLDGAALEATEVARITLSP